MKFSRRQAIAAGAALPTAALAPRLARAAAHDGMGAPRGAWHRKLTLGDVTAFTLLDGSTPRDDPHSIFGLNVDDATFAQVSEENFLPTETAQFFFTPVLVQAGGNTILFDTGLGQGGIARALEDAGMTTGDVTHVVITHMHPDHVGGLMTDGAPTFANAEHVTGSAEFNHWVSGDAVAGHIMTNVMPLAERFRMIEPGDDVVSGVTSLKAFGHTPGHMAYNVESDGQRLIVAADAANHYVMSLQKPDWHVRFDMDKEAAAQTRKDLFGMIAADKVAFTGYHMPFPSLGYVEALPGGGFRYVAASYQFYV